MGRTGEKSRKPGKGIAGVAGLDRGRQIGTGCPSAPHDGGARAAAGECGEGFIVHR